MSLGNTVRNSEIVSFGANAPVLGTAGIVGEVDYGPEGPTLLRSISQLAELFGPRSVTSAGIYDWADAFFALGGRRIYLERVLNGGAAAAKLELETTGKKKALNIAAKYKGILGNGLKIELVENEAKTKLKLVIRNSEGEIVESSGEYAKAEELLAWGETHTTWVTITQGSEYAGGKTEKLEKLAATKLAGGTNPTALSDPELVAGLAAFNRALGPMRVAIPGHTSEEIHKGLAEHAATHEARRAVGELADSSNPQTLIGERAGIPVAQQSYIDFTSSSATIPGTVPNTTRKVPGSAPYCALGAQVANTDNMNQALAGADWPVSPYVLGFTNTFTPAQQETLVEAGINVWGEELGALCLVGYVSAVSREVDEIYWSAAAGNERMALTYEGGLIMQSYDWKTIDGRGHLITKCKGQLQELIKRHWENNALYGNESQEAGSVEVGEPINTPASEQRGELDAEMQVRISEYVQASALVIVSRPLTATVGS